jgi:ketosteroid isomerase-like protein
MDDRRDGVDLGDVLRRLDRLEAVEAITAVKTRYAHLCDALDDPAAIAGLFTEDAVWDGGQYGRHEGRAEIEAFFAGIGAQFRWALHLIIAPDIHVSADATTATGSWYLLEPVTMPALEGSGEDAVVILGRYVDTFRKVDGRWYISRLESHVAHVSDLDKGWVRQPMRGA